MEGQRYLCPGCGSPIPTEKMDFKTREATCDFCGLHFVFPKKHSTASPNAVIALNEAYHLFVNGSFESAKDSAQTALSMTSNNVAALFIVAYYDAFIASVKNSKSLDRLFYNVLKDAEFEIEEEEMFKKLLIKTLKHTSEYEKEILSKFSEYDDAKELGDFVDQFSPYSILSKTNFDLFDKELFDLYKKVIKKTHIPKTLFSLTNFLLKCSDSPLASNSFFLKTKAKRIYDEYILPIGELFAVRSRNEIEEKIYSSYIKIKNDYYQRLSSEF